MRRRFRFAVVALAALIGCSCLSRSTGTSLPPIPRAELRLAADATDILDRARKLMLADGNVALVTVDDSGQPRVRTVRAFVDPVDPNNPASGVTVWIMTRFTTRKVDQIRQHQQVALYFNDDAQESYASIMGVATVHTDPGHAGAKRHYDEGIAKFFWPDFPRDFVMLEVKPRWIEFIGPGVPNDDRTWRPQAVVFEP